MATKSPKPKKNADCFENEEKCTEKEVPVPVDKISSIVIENIIKVLGKSKFFTKKRATKINEGPTRTSYRVNFWSELPNDDEKCEALTTKFRITDSFFVWVDQKGTILKSNPEILPRY